MRQLKLYGTAALAALLMVWVFYWIVIRGSNCQMLRLLWQDECKGSKVECYQRSQDVMWRCWTFRETPPP